MTNSYCLFVVSEAALNNSEIDRHLGDLRKLRPSAPR